MMSATKINYPFCVSGMGMQCLGSANRKGKVFYFFVDKMTNQHSFFRMLIHFLQFHCLLPTCFLNMSYFSIIVTHFLLLILVRWCQTIDISFSRLVNTFYFMIYLNKFFVNLLDLDFEKMSLMFTTKLPFFKQLLLVFNQ